ncbi:MAG TPA: NAD-dependent epimerase/dehydratase family protein [Candidatus Paceibacterota bacterium]|nr:NAD-dependent epimerase/dehydratase family protein [Candidatus Paceibacterota bacterium]
MKPILITGGAGFVGSNLAAALASSGNDVIIADNFSRPGVTKNVEWLRSRYGNRILIHGVDIRNQNILPPLVSGVGGVLHLAAQVAVTTSLKSPIEDFEINARGTLNVLETVRTYNPEVPVIFASTNKVYGRLFEDYEVEIVGDRYRPRDEKYRHGVDESAPLDLHSPYGCSKGAADQYVLDYARVYDLRTAVIRMSCIYGPRQFGTEDQGWVAHFLIRAIEGRPITIYGDGYQVRDILYVEDAVRAWLGIFSNIDDVKGKVFNLGGGPGNAVSLRELLQIISRLDERKPEVTFEEWRSGDQPWYVSDIRKISRAVNWSPQVGVEKGVAALHRWLYEMRESVH